MCRQRSTPSTSSGAQVWTAERRAQASLKSKERIAAKKSPPEGGREGKADAFLNPVLIQVLVICYQMLEEGGWSLLVSYWFVGGGVFLVGLIGSDR